MSRIIEAFKQYFTDTGEPLAKGWLYFLESGTADTEKNTYADVNLEIANTNPLQLDASGRCPNVFGSGTYRVISYTNDEVNDQPDEQIELFDPVGASVDVEDFSDWGSTITYNATDIVKASNNYYYKSLTNNNQGNNPTTDATNWQRIVFGYVFNENRTYSQKDLVLDIDTGVSYISLTDNNLSNTPSTDTTNWKNISLISDAPKLLADLNLNGHDFVTSSGGTTISNEEFAQLDGITAGGGTIFSQLEDKEPTISGAASTIAHANLTANMALISNSDGKVTTSASVSKDEQDQLDGITAGGGTIYYQLQTIGRNQLSGKSATGVQSGTLGTDTYVNVPGQDYSFAPMIWKDSGDAPEISVHAYSFNSDPNDTTMRIRLRNQDGSATADYAVRWRYMTATDRPFIHAIQDENGNIQHVWACDDPPPDLWYRYRTNRMYRKNNKPRGVEAPITLWDGRNTPIEVHEEIMIFNYHLEEYRELIARAKTDRKLLHKMLNDDFEFNESQKLFRRRNIQL